MKKSLILIALCLLLALPLCACDSDYRNTLKANWGFSIRKEAGLKVTYEKSSGSSFHGDGIRYHVFSYDNEDYIAILFNDWLSREKQTLSYDSFSEAMEAWLDSIDVPKEERPNPSQCYFHYDRKEDNSEIILFWDMSVQRLYIVEFFL